MQARARGMKLRREKAAALKAAREEKTTVIASPSAVPFGWGVVSATSHMK